MSRNAATPACFPPRADAKLSRRAWFSECRVPAPQLIASLIGHGVKVRLLIGRWSFKRVTLPSPVTSLDELRVIAKLCEKRLPR